MSLISANVVPSEVRRTGYLGNRRNLARGRSVLASLRSARAWDLSGCVETTAQVLRLGAESSPSPARSYKTPAGIIASISSSKI